MKSHIKRLPLLFIILNIFYPCVFSQYSKIDSLQILLKKDKEDTSKVNHLNELAWELIYSNSDTSILLSTQALQLAERQKWKKGIAGAYFQLSACKYLRGDYTIALEYGNKALALYDEFNDNNGIARTLNLTGLAYSNQGDYAKALERYFEAFKMDEELRDKKGIATVLGNIGIVYLNQGDYSNAIDYYLKALKIAEELGNKDGIANHLGNIGLVYDNQGNYSKALGYYFKALEMNEELGNKIRIATNLGNIGLVYSNQGDYLNALDYYLKALKKEEEIGNKSGMARNLGNIGEVYYNQANYAKALDYYLKALNMTEDLGDKYLSTFWLGSIGRVHTKTGKFKQGEAELKKAIALADSMGLKNHLRQFEESLSQLYDTTGRYDLALIHYKKAMVLKDTLFNQEKNKEITRKEMNYAFDKKEAAAKAQQEKKDSEAQRIKNVQYFMIAALGILVLAVLTITFIQWRNNKHKERTNILLQQQKEKVEGTLAELKSTQTQLIQQEKMASLGELTAGIAHEIQNPLNFVNNFSEVNSELIDEANQEIEKGNINEVKTILNDIKDNEHKIIHHGRRADTIVKGMLQHSRASTGQKEPTDINALVDEYLRLAYHGFRAKDKSFTAKFETNLDRSIGKIDVVPQDIGRVLLNLINNAFYAVAEKRQQLNGSYEPAVMVTTRKVNDTVEIRVQDNGNGIPQKVLDKIFQPFFTTKPTGVGTGLGLSLSYDIVTKGHGGELKVHTVENAGSEFIIRLPV